MFLAMITSIVASIGFSVMLKFLHYFSFIKWHPIGFVKKWDLALSPWPAWLLLTVVFFLLFFVMYLLFQYAWRIPAFVTSLIFGCCMALLAEWIIFDLPAERASFKKLSIPLIVTTVIFCRFIITTAQFHYYEKKFARRNKLMYENTMIK